MKLPRDLSGCDLAAALCRHWGYEKVNQLGSHIILLTGTPFPHRIAVSAHKALRIGTLNAILVLWRNTKGQAVTRYFAQSLADSPA